MDSISLSARWNFTAPLSTLLPPLSLFSFLLARFPPRANLVTRIHSKRNYPMQRKLQVYVCIRVAGTEGRGPIGCAGLSKTSNNKTFLRFPKPIRHRRHHLPHSTYQSRRRSTISIPPSIANRLYSRNLNSQLLQFFFARLCQTYAISGS